MSSIKQFDPDMSIYIPRCDTRSLPRRRVRETKEAYEARIKSFIISKFKLHYGNAIRVDLIAKQTADRFTYYVAFVHMQWYDTPGVRQLQADIIDPNVSAKLYYSQKWFWYLNKNFRPSSSQSPQPPTEESLMQEFRQKLNFDMPILTRSQNISVNTIPEETYDGPAPLIFDPEQEKDIAMLQPTCLGCLHNQAGQEAHMGPNGCLGDMDDWSSCNSEEEKDSSS